MDSVAESLTSAILTPKVLLSFLKLILTLIFNAIFHTAQLIPKTLGFENSFPVFVISLFLTTYICLRLFFVIVDLVLKPVLYLLKILIYLIAFGGVYYSLMNYDSKVDLEDLLSPLGALKAY